jgi:hypothetical protein
MPLLYGRYYRSPNKDDDMPDLAEEEYTAIFLKVPCVHKKATLEKPDYYGNRPLLPFIKKMALSKLLNFLTIIARLSACGRIFIIR